MHKPSATLLIADDDDVVRASLAAYLDDSGFRVLQAANGPQGMELFESEQPDLVICDLRMPQMDGLELIRQISERQIDLPVIVVSGAGVMSDAVEALRLGAADYLIKPLEDLAMLEHSVRRALDRSRLRLEIVAIGSNWRLPTATCRPACIYCRKIRTPGAGFR